MVEEDGDLGLVMTGVGAATVTTGGGEAVCRSVG